MILMILLLTHFLFGRYKVADVILEKRLEPLAAVNKNKAAENNSNKDQKEVPVQDVKQYAGAFYSEELDVTYVLTENDGQLFCSIKSKKPFPLKAKALDLFSSEDLEFRFSRDSKNKIDEFRINAGRVTNLKFTRK